MAALNEIARNYADEIRDGIAWVLVWKTGRSWNATAVWLDAETDTFEPDDLDTAREILKQDPNAVMLNGYYCGHFGEDMTVKELAAGIRWHYEGGYNTLDGSTAFPPEPTERPTDLPAGMAWRDTPATEEPDPYVYDGHMSPKDYELMHKNREAADPYTYDVEAFGETWRVLATANRYAANKTLAVSLTTEEGEPFAVITVNITASDFKADDHTAFLDVNNCPWAEEFLRKTGLGKPTGILGHSGYCTYPLYTFDTTRMKPGGSGSTKRPKTLKKAIGKEN